MEFTFACFILLVLIKLMFLMTRLCVDLDRKLWASDLQGIFLSSDPIFHMLYFPFSTKCYHSSWWNGVTTLSQGQHSMSRLIKLRSILAFYLSQHMSCKICIIIKVSGATARWPFTDSAVPSSLLLFLLLFSHFFKSTFRNDYKGYRAEICT